MKCACPNMVPLSSSFKLPHVCLQSCIGASVKPFLTRDQPIGSCRFFRRGLVQCTSEKEFICTYCTPETLVAMNCYTSNMVLNVNIVTTINQAFQKKVFLVPFNVASLQYYFYKACSSLVKLHLYNQIEQIIDGSQSNLTHWNLLSCS